MYNILSLVEPVISDILWTSLKSVPWGCCSSKTHHGWRPKPSASHTFYCVRDWNRFSVAIFNCGIPVYTRFSCLYIVPLPGYSSWNWLHILAHTFGIGPDRLTLQYLCYCAIVLTGQGCIREMAVTYVRYVWPDRPGLNKGSHSGTSRILEQEWPGRPGVL